VLEKHARAATKVKPTVANAVHAFYHGEGIDTECPDYNITQHTRYKYWTSLPLSTCILLIYA